MKYLGKITDSKDLVTKEYVDNSIPAAASTTPAMSSNTAAIGSSTDFARADHVHPSDTSKSGVTLKVWVEGEDTEQQLSTLIINKVDSIDAYNEMVEDDLVNEDELYFVEDADQELGLGVVSGLLCHTFDAEYGPWDESGDTTPSGPITNVQIDALF